MNQRKLLSAQVSEAARSERALAALLLGVGMVCYFCSGYLRFANTCAKAVHPVESYIILGSQTKSFTCAVFMPLMLLTFDAPCLSERSVYEIVRVGKKRWLRAKIQFLVLEVVVYQLLILGFSMLLTVCSARELVGRDWSPAMDYLTGAAQGLARREFNLYFPYPEMMQSLSPWASAGVTFLLNGAYCLVLALVMVHCNILLKDTRGWVVAAGIHILGFVISHNGGLFFRLDFSLLECALAAWQLAANSWRYAALSGAVFAGALAVLLLPLGKLEKWLIR